VQRTINMCTVFVETFFFSQSIFHFHTCSTWCPWIVWTMSHLHNSFSQTRVSRSVLIDQTASQWEIHHINSEFLPLLHANDRRTVSPLVSCYHVTWFCSLYWKQEQLPQTFSERPQWNNINCQYMFNISISTIIQCLKLVLTNHDTFHIHNQGNIWQLGCTSQLVHS
jgi:uncharacterized membrane protein YhdT